MSILESIIICILEKHFIIKTNRDYIKIKSEQIINRNVINETFLKNIDYFFLNMLNLKQTRKAHELANQILNKIMLSLTVRMLKEDESFNSFLKEFGQKRFNLSKKTKFNVINIILNINWVTSDDGFDFWSEKYRYLNKLFLNILNSQTNEQDIDWLKNINFDHFLRERLN